MQEHSRELVKRLKMLKSALQMTWSELASAAWRIEKLDRPSPLRHAARGTQAACLAAD